MGYDTQTIKLPLRKSNWHTLLAYCISYWKCTRDRQQSLWAGKKPKQMMDRGIIAFPGSREPSGYCILVNHPIASQHTTGEQWLFFGKFKVLTACLAWLSTVTKWACGRKIQLTSQGRDFVPFFLYTRHCAVGSDMLFVIPASHAAPMLRLLADLV